MTSCCDQAMTISNYVKSNVNNISSLQCYSLQSDSIDTSSMTVNGTLINNNLDSYHTKTQYQTATLNNTTFTGDVNVSDLNSSLSTITTPSVKTDAISSFSTPGSLNILGDLSSQNTITASYSGSISSSTVVRGLQSNLENDNKVIMRLGRDDSENNSGEISFTYVSSGSNDNSLDLKVTGSTTSNLSVNNVTTTLTGPIFVKQSGYSIPQLLNVRRSSGLTNMQDQSTYTFTWDPYSENMKYIEIQLINLMKTSPNTDIPRIQFGTSTFIYDSSYVGTLAYSGLTFQLSQSAATWNSSGIQLLRNAFTTNVPYNATIVLTKVWSDATGHEIWTIHGSGSTTTSSHHYCGNFIATNDDYKIVDTIKIVTSATFGNWTSGYINVTTQ